MKLRTTLLCLFITLGGAAALLAQMPAQYSAMSAKVLLIDYGTPNDVDDQDVTYGLEVAFRRQFGKYLGLALPLKFGVADLPDQRENRNFVSIDGLLHLFPLTAERKVSPYLLGGIGVVSEDFADSHTQIPVGLGLNWQVGENSYLNVQGEYRIASQDLRDNLQLGLGYVYRFGKSDQDGDGVLDADDACPELAGPAATQGCPDRDNDGIADNKDDCPDQAGLKALRGCPDRDGDGIADDKDACPDLAGTAAGSGCPDSDGDGLFDHLDKCPQQAGPANNEGCPLSDRDADGIVDAEDACPDAAGPAATRGCPDRDGDGVADADDRCPDQPGRFAGCPDTDGDGILDPDDLCPNEPGLVTNKGCPEIKQEVREVLNLAMRAVQFETGSANLKAESYDVLNQIVDIMGQYPAYRLSIAGHTDNVGDDASNLRLSEERAKSCFQYLASKGVLPARISFAGYGETQPVADNSTAQGRRLNRRVEFDLRIP